MPPFASWATAATNIQDAVDASATGDQVFVTNGIYRFGGRQFARVLVTNAIIVQSVNGATATVIEGGGEYQCARLASGSMLMGFTLTNGAAGEGGGVSGPLNTNAIAADCILTGNIAQRGGGGESLLSDQLCPQWKFCHDSHRRRSAQLCAA
jgi:hypothetical protein